MVIIIMINWTYLLYNLSKNSLPAALPQNRILSMALTLMEFSCLATENTQLPRKKQNETKKQFTEAKAEVDKNERIGVGEEGDLLKKF